MRHFSFLDFLLLLVATTSAIEIFSIADLHADRENAIILLKLMNLIPSNFEFGKGEEFPQLLLKEDQFLVQTGDLLDRGPHGMYLLNMSMYWKSTHPNQFFQLMGNHELMNLYENYHYVAMDELLNEPNYHSLIKDTQSPVRKYLLEECLVAKKLGDVLFVHAGMMPAFVEQQPGTPSPNDGEAIIDQMNEEFKIALNNAKHHRGRLLGGDGPLWTRALAQSNPSARTCNLVYRTLDAIGAKVMVVGHTPQRNGKAAINCWEPEKKQSIILADTGISKYYGSNIAGLKFINNTMLQVFYIDQVHEYNLADSSQTKLVPRVIEYSALEQLEKQKELSILERIFHKLKQTKVYVMLVLMTREQLLQWKMTKWYCLAVFLAIALPLFLRRLAASNTKNKREQEFTYKSASNDNEKDQKEG